jgi:hypothetical protein
MIHPQIAREQYKPNSQSHSSYLQTEPNLHLPCPFNHTEIIDRLSYKKQIELPMIVLTHTIPNPKTMMIITKYTTVTFAAVTGSIREIFVVAHRAG